jgi:hypothetical protein
VFCGHGGMTLNQKLSSGKGGEMVTSCYDFFDCKKTQCPMFYEGEKRNCWDVANTPCLIGEDGKSLDIDGDEKFFCKNCLYFEHVKKHKS